MIYKILILLSIQFALYGSEIPNFSDMKRCKNVVFFLSTPKSGSNLVSCSLSIITRKPISWLNWKNNVFDPSSECRKHPSYNRLGLPLISDIPLLYRTHYDFTELMTVPSSKNKLVFVTRNPKELLFRKFFIKNPSSNDPDPQFIDEFLDSYLKAFQVYDSWFPENRLIVFYEDFIDHSDDILLQLLQFMNEEPKYLDDYIINKQYYISKLLESYKKQHVHNSGGSSSRESPKAIYYSQNVSLEILMYIDEYIRKVAPQIWGNYLKRFQV